MGDADGVDSLPLHLGQDSQLDNTWPNLEVSDIGGFLVQVPCEQNAQLLCSRSGVALYFSVSISALFIVCVVV